MKYLFFDCECANCYHHEGKICSFGYVVSDENFKVLEQADIVINPDAPFDPHVLGVGERSINLAYTPLRFAHAPKFDAVFAKISGLLGDPDTQVFGYAIENDLGFLLSECRRYSLTLPEFAYFDIQDYARLEGKWERSPSLEDALKSLQVPYDAYAEHQSDDDAAMSMLLLKGLLSADSLSMAAAQKAYPQCAGRLSLFQKQLALASLKKDLGLPYDPEFRDKQRDYQELVGLVPDNAASEELKGKRYCLSPNLLASPDLALDLANLILDRSGLLVRQLREATVYLVYDEEEKAAAEPLLSGTGIAVFAQQEWTDSILGA